MSVASSFKIRYVSESALYDEGLAVGELLALASLLNEQLS